ncbi:MAG TPA: response regulator [Pyrinomonadaceae bacterium]|nr:response regulator [Pyrinomonadaceae bacterium]
MARPILIIEDDPDIAEVLRYCLEAHKFETRVALTGNEGLSASLDKDQPPLLILLDLLLPEMNGLEICRRVRRDPATARIPIIMVTAKASESDFVSARAAGVDDYITKPFSVQKVIERIGVLLSVAEKTV